MNSFDRLKHLQERFLSKDEKTGDPSIDSASTEFVDTTSETEEVEAFMLMAQNSAINVYLAIDMLLKHGDQKALDSYFGEGSHALLKETQECIEGIASLFGLEGKEEPAESEEEPKEPEEEPTLELDVAEDPTEKE